MKSCFVLNASPYHYEFNGLTFKAKSARPVTPEQEKALRGNVAFMELVGLNKFTLSDNIPDEYKTNNERLQEAIQRVQELETMNGSEEIAALKKEVERLAKENSDLLAEATKELAKKEAEIAELKAQLKEGK